MNTKARNRILITASTLVATAAFGFAAPRFSEPDEGDAGEQVQKIEYKHAPKSVRRTFDQATNSASPTKVEKIVVEDVTKYEIEYDMNGMTASVTLSDRGEVLETETPIHTKDLPDRVVREIMKDYPGAKIKAAEAVQLSFYEMDVEINGKTVEVAAFATGDIEDRLLGNGENSSNEAQDNDEERGEHADNDEDHDEHADNDEDHEHHGHRHDDEEDDDD